MWFFKPKISAGDLQYVQATLDYTREAADQINTTAQGATFFYNLHLTLDLLLRLKPYEKYKIFKHSTPSDNFRNIIDGLEATVNAFIDRHIRAYPFFTPYLVSQHFDQANSYWNGSYGEPHYTGILFTQANYQRAQRIARSEESIQRILADLKNGVTSVPPVLTDEWTIARERFSYDEGSRKLSYSEKEMLAVLRTTQADVLLLTGFPYSWNTPVQKFISPNGHPFVYMNIIGSNIAVARNELTKINELIVRDRRLCRDLPRNLSIPIHEIVFTPQETSGYSRLMCTPVTYDGSLSDMPIALSFMTDLEKDRSTHGDIYYDRSGNICKAELYFWRDDGYFLYYATVDSELVLERVELALSLSGSRITVYKGAHIIAAELALEAKRREEENAFLWLQVNIPDKCPKTVTGYRRMKTQNTKNYQQLKALAAQKGKKI